MSGPRGLVAGRPRSDAAALVDSAKAIINDYTDQLPQTLRQVFYIAVTRSLIRKTEKDCNRPRSVKVDCGATQATPT